MVSLCHYGLMNVGYRMAVLSVAKVKGSEYFLNFTVINICH